MTGDWTLEAAAAISLCKSWTKDLAAQISCEVYLFGSAIYESGDQFDAQQSDLDLVVLFSDAVDTTERAKRLSALRQFKASLELFMVPALCRTNCEEPGVSVVPVTSVELQANIHKSGARRFFDKNIFLNLKTDIESVGIPSAGTCSVAEEARQALEYVQKLRNEFLAVSANGTGGVALFDGADPLPKSLARVAAQLVPDLAVGAWYDTRFGLEYIWEELSRRRSESEQIKQLYRKISIRRGGRGKRQRLSDYDQLLLAEILYDLAAAFPLEPIVTWEIRFKGASPSDPERERFIRDLRSLVPDAEIIGVFEGSIVVRLRSSKRSYLTVNRLQELKLLTTYFEWNDIDVSKVESDGGQSGFKPEGVIDKIAERIASWHPQPSDSIHETEVKLAQWLETWLQQEQSLAGVNMIPQALIRGRERPFRADILVSFLDKDKEQRVVIELKRLQTRSGFFDVLDRLRGIGLPTIFVVVGSSGLLAGLQRDIKKLGEIDGSIRVVPIEFG